MPLVVRMTLAPVAKIFRMRSRVMSDSLLPSADHCCEVEPIYRARIASSCSGSSIVMCTPRCIRCFARLMSRQAILALVTRSFIAELPQRITLSIGEDTMITLARDRTVQRISLDHEALPCALPMCFEHVHSLDRVFLFAAWVDGLDREHGIDGHWGEDIVVSMIAVKGNLELGSMTYTARIFELMDVLATLTRASRPSLSTLVESWSAMNRHASLHASLKRRSAKPVRSFGQDAPVASNHGGGVNLVSHQIVRSSQQLGSEQYDRSGTVSDLLVLLCC